MQNIFFEQSRLMDHIHILNNATQTQNLANKGLRPRKMLFNQTCRENPVFGT